MNSEDTSVWPLTTELTGLWVSVFSELPAAGSERRKPHGLMRTGCSMQDSNKVLPGLLVRDTSAWPFWGRKPVFSPTKEKGKTEKEQSPKVTP